MTEIIHENPSTQQGFKNTPFAFLCVDFLALTHSTYSERNVSHRMTTSSSYLQQYHSIILLLNFNNLTLTRLVGQHFTVALQAHFQFCTMTFLLVRQAGYAHLPPQYGRKPSSDNRPGRTVTMSLWQTPRNTEQISTAWCFNVPPASF